MKLPPAIEQRGDKVILREQSAQIVELAHKASAAGKAVMLAGHLMVGPRPFAYRMPDYVSMDGMGFHFPENATPRFSRSELEKSIVLFAKYYRKARLITFTEVKKEGLDDNALQIRHHDEIAGRPILDLPFEVCVFDVVGREVTRFDRYGKVRFIAALLVAELEPGIYEYFSLEAEINDNMKNDLNDIKELSPDFMGVGEFKLVHIPSTWSKDILFDYHFQVKLLVANLRAESNAVGSAKVKEFVKLGQGKDRRKHKISEVIFVTPKKNKGMAREALGREIDWSHRWEVRGHYRRIAGIGKNRAGEYGLKGHTWVTPHVKGPEDKPVVKKQRVVQVEQ